MYQSAGCAQSWDPSRGWDPYLSLTASPSWARWPRPLAGQQQRPQLSQGRSRPVLSTTRAPSRSRCTTAFFDHDHDEAAGYAHDHDDRDDHNHDDNDHDDHDRSLCAPC